jgi:hypothetical protein
MAPTHSGSSDLMGSETTAVSATQAALEAISRLEGAYGH